MNPIVLGNCLSLVACILMVTAGLLKTKKNILISQTFQSFLFGISNFVLGGYSGFISGMVSIFRNLLFFKVTPSKKLKVMFIIIYIILSYQPGNFKFIELMPIIAVSFFTWYLDTPSEITLKKMSIGTSFCWVLYDLNYLNFVSFTFDCLSIMTNIIGIQMILKDQKNALK